ncbi:MAG: restriction endonuclease subunit S [Alistipes sp.]|nr:restriction endonuclease subunit S [Alistipes sp.]
MTIPQGYKWTELGIIPEDWEVKQISDFTTVVTGGTPSTQHTEYWGGDIRWMNSGELNLKFVYDVEGRITEEGLHNSSTHVIPAECVLVGLAGQGKTRGTAAYNLVSLCTNQSIAAFLPTDKHSSLYLYYVIDSKYDYLRLLSSGDGGRGGLNKQILGTINVVLPPIAEQRAIAEALSDVDGLIAALDKKIAKKRLLKQGAMWQLLTGKTRLPGFTDEWETIRLGDWATMNSGGTPTSSVPEYYNGHIPFLSISDITEAGKYINKTEKTITEKGLNNSSARMFPAGTIMYAMYASLGKCSIANIELSCSQAILGITPKCRINPEYLYYYLSFIEEDVRDMGQTGTQSNLSKQIVQGFMVKLPSDIKEQQAIATILSDMDKEITDLEAQRDKYRLLKSGMMQKLLTGQIRLKNE